MRMRNFIKNEKAFFVCVLSVCAALVFGVPRSARAEAFQCGDVVLSFNAEDCGDLLTFFDDAIENKALIGSLEGIGKQDKLAMTPSEKRSIKRQRVDAVRALIDKACELIAIDPYFHCVAVDLLQTAHERCDNVGPDYVSGAVQDQLACGLLELIDSLDCPY